MIGPSIEINRFRKEKTNHQDFMQPNEVEETEL